MLPLVGALLSGGTSLISGLLGRMGAKEQAKKEEAALKEANRVASENAARMNLEVRARADAAALVPYQSQRGVDMDAFMAAAEDYGFNPLTFLRSGALSSFEWSCSTGEHAMDAALAGQYIPQLAPVIAQTRVPSMGEVFGNALTSGANQYLQEAAVQQAFQNDVMRMQLQGAQRQGSYSGLRFGTVPQAFVQSETGFKKTNGVDPAFEPLFMFWKNNDPNDPDFGKIVRSINPKFPDLEQAAAGGVAQPVDPNFNPKDPFKGVISGAWGALMSSEVVKVLNPTWIETGPIPQPRPPLEITVHQPGG